MGLDRIQNFPLQLWRWSSFRPISSGGSLGQEFLRPWPGAFLGGIAGKIHLIQHPAKQVPGPRAKESLRCRSAVLPLDKVIVHDSQSRRLAVTQSINGGLDPNGNLYKFIIWETDRSPDTLRIRIWWEADGVETDIYGNGAEQAIGAGNIVVHTE
jgi:hypothetical protein